MFSQEEKESYKHLPVNIMAARRTSPDLPVKGTMHWMRQSAKGKVT
ncbi:MAG: hypothetical protein J1E57_12045 [Prevotella sp.]|nr:hypothetical protein [Prevotella sp.]